MKPKTLYDALSIMKGVGEAFCTPGQKPDLQMENPELYSQPYSDVYVPVTIGNDDGAIALMWLRETRKNHRTDTYLCCSSHPDFINIQDAERLTHLNKLDCTALRLSTRTDDTKRQEMISMFVEDIKVAKSIRTSMRSKDFYAGF